MWFKHLDSSNDVNTNLLPWKKPAPRNVFSTHNKRFEATKLLFKTQKIQFPKRGLKNAKNIQNNHSCICRPIIIIVVGFGAVIFLDVASLTATGSQTLTPTGHSVGNALVAYDPGLSGDTKNVAQKVVSVLQEQGYTVTLAGIKNSAVSHTAFDIIVVGGPVYAGSLTSSVKDALNSLIISQGTKLGVFGSGQGSTTPDDVAMLKQSIPTSLNNALTNAVVVKIGKTEDISARTQDLFNQLIE